MLPPRMIPFDLHVLGTPPAFVLSQDQTLRQNLNPEGHRIKRAGNSPETITDQTQNNHKRKTLTMSICV